ncbi:MAG TPA: type II toxin-antitoxin system VapC family toxin [Fimbriimonadaceae bacterium]|nr:type II toxin-antitoxin system VapC family toxin [Fimbriimonadaceae bacterium]
MRCLLDTNILLRLVQAKDPNNLALTRAVEGLQDSDVEVCCTAQALRELWHAATRQESANGLGLSHSEAGALLQKVVAQCTILYETESSFTEWRRIVEIDGITGAACHDANRAAIALVNGVDRILTFDGSDFRRFKSAGLTVLEPKDLVL